jgi:hypothetical protein
MNLSRRELARWWGSFVLLWSVAALVTLQINFLVCHAENSGPESGSARASYCGSISDFLSSGEPAEWTTPLPYLLPFAVLAAVGGYGIWRQSKRFLSRAAIVAVGALVGHLIVLAVLPG